MLILFYVFLSFFVALMDFRVKSLSMTANKTKTRPCSVLFSSRKGECLLHLQRYENEEPLDVVTVNEDGEELSSLMEWSEIENAFPGFELEIMERDGDYFHGVEVL